MLPLHCTPFLLALALGFAQEPSSLEAGPPGPGPLLLPAPEGDPIPALLARVQPARILADVETLVGFHTRHTLSETESNTRGIGAARRWIEAELRRIAESSEGRMRVETQSAARSFRTRAGQREVEVVNVMATLLGTQNDPLGRTYVVSGHYDSRVGDRWDAESFAPGADDDASGTAVVLELARCFADAQVEANLIFLCVAGEEQGLWGAELFDERMAEAGVDVDAFLTNDIVGGTEGGGGDQAPQTLRVFSGADKLHSPSRELARLIQLVGRKYVPAADVRMVFRLDRFGRGGDHIPMHNRGVASVRFSEAFEHYDRQHKQVQVVDGRSFGDLPEHLDPEFMGLVARVNGAALLELAMAPPPPSTLVLRAAVRYDTALRWKVRGAPAGFEVLWRDTTAPQWEASLQLPMVGEPGAGQDAVAPKSADWVFYGLRALGPGGHGSRIIFPGRP